LEYQGNVVEGQVVGLEQLSQVDEGEEEEQHQRGDEEPAVDQPVALKLVRLRSGNGRISELIPRGGDCILSFLYKTVFTEALAAW
jgi:hypothetical protein